MVAAANPLATEAGYEILRAGGNAIDAAIAVQLVLGLVEPQSSGLGGGAFLLYHDAKTGRLVAYDGRETAPAAARPDRFLDADGKPLAFYDAVVGGRSVGVPGTVKLLETVHRRHGRLPWPRLFRRAIALAEDGFPISPRLHALTAAETHWSQPRARDYFLTADGRGPAGRRALAQSRVRADAAHARRAGRERVLRRGRSPTTSFARPVTRTRNPGDLTRRTSRDTRSRCASRCAGDIAPIASAACRCRRRAASPCCRSLKMLEPYDIASMGPASFWSVHFVSEAERLAYADRSVYMADPDFFRPPAGLLDDDYLHARSLLISANRSLGVASPGDPGPSAKRARASSPTAATRRRVPVDVADRDRRSPTATRCR